MAVRSDIFSQKNIEREFIIRMPPRIQRQPHAKAGKSHAYLFIVPLIALSGIIALLQIQGVSLNAIFARPDYIIEIVAEVILIDIAAYISSTTLFE
jgi:hypothetical protein